MVLLPKQHGKAQVDFVGLSFILKLHVFAENAANKSPASLLCSQLTSKQRCKDATMCS